MKREERELERLRKKEKKVMWRGVLFLLFVVTH